MPRSVVTLPPQGHYIRKHVRSATYARHAAGFAIFLLVVALPIYRLGGIGASALIAVILLAGLLALISLIVAVIDLARVWFGAALGGGKAFHAAILAFVGLAPFGLFVAMTNANPNTNMAYTEAFAPDVADAIDMEASQSVLNVGAPANRALPPIVPGRRYEVAAPEVAATIGTTLADLGWNDVEIVAGDPSDGIEDDLLGIIRRDGGIPVPTPRAGVDSASARPTLPDADIYQITSVARDPLLALPSDVTIRVVADGAGALVDIRSVSRETGIDLGQNRRFIAGFFEALDREMAGPAAVSGS